MAIQFEAETNYLGKPVTIKADDFKELHRALARIDDLNRDGRHLHKKTGAKDFTLTHRKDTEGNEYFGVQEKRGRRNITFGQLREGGLIPFFPKGDDGYYDPSNPPQGGRPTPEPEHQRPAPQDGYASEQDDLPY